MSEDINELFMRDPFKYSQQDLDEIIKYMRQWRKEFLAGNKTSRGRTTKKGKAQKEILSLAKDLDLEL
ncbi:hypothetical protein D6827_01660 [Candidatus Parcubacteria bacterium]|nr:MAG: hypothetical protein D6827_01660 [Candidatus Parcubacteria bacterium]